MSGLSIAFDSDPIRQIAAILREAPDLVSEEIAAGIYEAELLLQREVMERTPSSGAGTLRNSIIAAQPSIEGETILGSVTTPLPYAQPVEFGAKPHMPPVQPIIDWVEAKLGLKGAEAKKAGWAIAMSIKAKGTEGAFMFTNALEANREQMGAILTEAAKRALARIAAEGEA